MGLRGVFPAGRFAGAARGRCERAVAVGVFRELWVGMLMRATIKLLRELYAADYRFACLVSLRASVQRAHGASFCKLTGATK